MRFKPRSVYDVLALISFFLVVGGGTALASYVISSNSQVGPGTISGHKPPNGDHANIIKGSVNGQDIAESSLGAVPNADKLDGQDSTVFGQVRDFSRSISAVGAGPPSRDMLSFKGLTLSSLGFISQNPFELGCILQATTTDAGQLDNSLIDHESNANTQAFSNGGSTPTDHKQLAYAVGAGSRIGGQLVFHDRDTGRTLTASYSIYIPGDSDINSQGCTWQGTVTAAG